MVLHSLYVNHLLYQQKLCHPFISCTHSCVSLLTFINRPLNPNIAADGWCSFHI